jgi:S-(hydroxymethyl)glutathione dehydrogenase / alcohol dehydrogenase
VTRAIVVREPGGPWSLESVRLAEPGPGQLRIKVLAAGLCRTDLSLARGSLQHPFPFVPGHEGLGTVLEVGDGDGAGPGEYAAGDRVLFTWTGPCGECWFCERGEGHLCERGATPADSGSFALEDGGEAQCALGVGAFAEETVVAARSVTRLTAAIPDEQAAVLGCAVATGFGAVHNTAGVRPGETVVVICVGGVGLSVVQAARDVGAARVIAVDPSEEHRDLALRLGADAAHAPGITLVKRLRTELGRGADHVFECVGRAATIRQAWSIARRGGQVVVVGAGAADDPVQFSALELFYTGRTLRGCVYGSFDPGRDLAALTERVASGAIDLAALVAPPVGLDQVPAAIAALDGGLGGRPVFVPALTPAGS